jgi:hypothetical protein
VANTASLGRFVHPLCRCIQEEVMGNQASYPLLNQAAAVGSIGGWKLTR